MDKYRVEKELGLDSLAERFVVQRNNVNQNLLLTKMELMDMTTVIIAYQEFQPLLKISNENLASIVDIFTSADYRISAMQINLIGEYFPMGNLDQYLMKLRDEKRLLKTSIIDRWSAQIFEGLFYLWSENFVHRNLRPESIYLRGNGDETRSSLVIADMIPESVAFDFRMRTRLTRRALSYMAPEIFRTDQHTIASDIYSVGCCLLDLISSDQLTDEETLQLRICARHDVTTLEETLENLKKNHNFLPTLIRELMMIEPNQRPTISTLKSDDYLIETMHNINSFQVKYPASHDRKSNRYKFPSNGKLGLYLNLLKEHGNTEAAVETLIDLCSESKSIDATSLAESMEKEIIPIVEYFRSNKNIVRSTLKLLTTVIDNDLILNNRIVRFLASLFSFCEKEENLIGQQTVLLMRLTKKNAMLLINARQTSDFVRVMARYERHAEISGNCCTLLWLMGKTKITADLRENLAAILKSLLNILQHHSNDSEIYRKAALAFLPLTSQKMTIAHLAQFNLVRYFTIGLNEHFRDRRAIKSGLLVLSELFQVDERCVLRFLCSRSTDGKLLDSMEILEKIFNYFKQENDVARAISFLIKSMLPYDDAVEEMISTNIQEKLIYQLKRFHADDGEIREICDSVKKRIEQKN